MFIVRTATQFVLCAVPLINSYTLDNMYIADEWRILKKLIRGKKVTFFLPLISLILGAIALDKKWWL